MADFVQALKIVQLGLDQWREKPHNAKWWKRIDGTPIPNDLCVVIAETLVTSNAIAEASTYSRGYQDAIEEQCQPARPVPESALIEEAASILADFLEHDAFWPSLRKQSQDDEELDSERRDCFYARVKATLAKLRAKENGK